MARFRRALLLLVRPKHLVPERFDCGSADRVAQCTLEGSTADGRLDAPGRVPAQPGTSTRLVPSDDECPGPVLRDPDELLSRAHPLAPDAGPLRAYAEPSPPPASVSRLRLPRRIRGRALHDLLGDLLGRTSSNAASSTASSTALSTASTTSSTASTTSSTASTTASTTASSTAASTAASTRPRRHHQWPRRPATIQRPTPRFRLRPAARPSRRPRSGPTRPRPTPPRRSRTPRRPAGSRS